MSYGIWHLLSLFLPTTMIRIVSLDAEAVFTTKPHMRDYLVITRRWLCSSVPANARAMTPKLIRVTRGREEAGFSRVKRGYK